MASCRGAGCDILGGLTRIALVHDWLTGMRGERVLQDLALLYPQADLYTLLHVAYAISLFLRNSGRIRPIPQFRVIRKAGLIFRSFYGDRRT